MDRIREYRKPMVQNLLKAGYNITVYNRTKDKESSLPALGAS
jgi:3-hydroxyisobutyrate dehydrogenase-like beta-hydroxyacid dehydrogenase